MSEAVDPDTVLGGRYRLEERLGSGGMATVWAATDLELDRPVAVKVISETLALDEAFMGRFRGEARIAATFAHPNVVRVYDFRGEGERPFLVMERIDGGTMADDPPPAVDPIELATQLLSALDHIHGAGVVHRDVKPANVLHDGEGRVLLTDFGIATSAEATRFTKTGEMIGTLRYMAPELQRGAEPSPRSDLYSLGVLLRESYRELPPALSALADALTAVDPDERPGSARAAMLELTSDPAPTARIEAEPAERAPGSRVAKALGLLAVALLAGAVAIGLLSGSDGEGGREPVSTPPEPIATEPTAPEAQELETAPPPDTEPVSCDGLEAEKDRLEEEGKATEEQLKDDKEAKEAAKEEFDERKHALDEEIEACKEAEKEA